MLITIDEKDSRPIYQQIVSQVREQVRSGIMKPGDELPSVRELADNLNVNMHTVRSAYLKLRDQGVINLRLGRRAKIAQFQASLAYGGMEEALKRRVRNLKNDALSAGLSQEDLIDLVRRQVKQSQKAR